MPDISASLDLLDATFFLYPSVEAAERGEQFGGSGVIVGYPLKSQSNFLMRYAVTNWHVACNTGSSVIRINLPDGRNHIIDKDPSEWTFLPGKQDLAACSLALPPEIQPTVVPTTKFITDRDKSDAHVGDDVFMVGRFIDFDGIETNKPATRYGAISMMDAPIKQPTGFNGRSIIVDMHSRTGFSGSPVYVYRPGAIILPFVAGGKAPTVSPPHRKLTKRTWGWGSDTEVRLLGILWGQFPELWEINARSKEAAGEASLVTEGAYVKGFSGMSCIIPASHIIQLLDHAELEAERESVERSFAPQTTIK